MSVIRRLYLNKYFETLLLFSFTCLFSHKLNAHLKVPTRLYSQLYSFDLYSFDLYSFNLYSFRIETLLLVRKSPRNETGLFALLSLCSRLNQSEDV